MISAFTGLIIQALFSNYPTNLRLCIKSTNYLFYVKFKGEGEEKQEVKCEKEK